jgi:hypothetical protein
MKSISAKLIQELIVGLILNFRAKVHLAETCAGIYMVKGFVITY